MTASEIDALCDDVARATGLPVAWVRHHVDQRAGRPCRRCGGTGTVARGSCFRCTGTGGRAQPSTVLAALTWVRVNAGRVRELGEARNTRAPALAVERRHKQAVQVTTWKRDHYDIWDIVDGLLPGDFKDSVTRAIESNSLSERQEQSLQDMVDSKKKRAVGAPPKGTPVTVGAVVLSAMNWFDHKQKPVLRVEFETVIGWRGRIDITDAVTISKVQGRRGDGVDLHGNVEWSKGGYAVVSGRVEVVGVPT